MGRPFSFSLSLSWLVKGTILSGRSRRSLRSLQRHFAVVVMILCPPKVSSERVADDVGIPRR